MSDHVFGGGESDTADHAIVSWCSIDSEAKRTFVDEVVVVKDQRVLETDVASFADVLSSAEVFLGFHVLVVLILRKKINLANTTSILRTRNYISRIKRAWIRIRRRSSQNCFYSIRKYVVERVDVSVVASESFASFEALFNNSFNKSSFDFKSSLKPSLIGVPEVSDSP